MRIAIITCFYSESTIALCKYLAKNNNSVDFYFITFWEQKEIPAFDFHKAARKPGLLRLNAQDAPETFRYLKNDDVTINIIRLYKYSAKYNFLNRIIVNRTFKKINSIDYNVINLVGQYEFLMFFHRKLSRFKRIHTLHEVTKHHRIQSISHDLIGYLFEKKIPVIVHSNTSYAGLMQYSECNRELVHNIPFGLFESYLQFDIHDMQIAGDDDVILFYGAMLPYKGLDTLVKALGILNGKLDKVKIVIAGNGYAPELDILKNHSRCIVINRVLLNKEIIALNKRAKVVICPYKSASQSGIIMTTFLFGKPIIASKVGAFTEVIDDGINGLLIKPDSPDELVNAIIRIFEEDKLYEKLATGASNFINSPEYNWNKIAKDTLSVYN